MALPTPTINLDELLVGSRNPAADLGVREGSVISIIPRAPLPSPYSPENLPEFMAGFEQVTPTTFAPVIGGTTTAGMTPEELALYQQREQAFRESFAIDPTMFGGGYRPSLYIPYEPPTPSEYTESDGLLEAALTYGAVKDYLPDIDIDLPDISKPDISLPSIETQTPEFIERAGEFFQEDIIDPAREFVEEKIVEPVGAGVEAIGEFGQEKVIDPIREFAEEKIVEPAKEFAKPITEPVGKGLQAVDEFVGEEIVDPLVDAAKAGGTFIDENIITPTVNFVESIIPDFDKPDIKLPEGSGFDISTYVDAAKSVGKAVGEGQALAEKPTASGAFDFVDAAAEASEAVGLESSVIPASTAGVLIDTAAVVSVIDALNDPSATNLVDAYGGIDHIMTNYTETDLPFGAEAAAVGDIAQGIEAISDGKVDNIGEAVSVANAVNTATGIAKGVTAGQSISAALKGATAEGVFGTTVIPQLATAAAFMTLAPAVGKALKGGAAGDFPRVQGDFSIDEGRFTSSNVMAADVSKMGLAGEHNQNWAKTTFDSATSMANNLIDSYGFEINEAALASAPKDILTIQSNTTRYNKEGEQPVNAPDFVIKMLQHGILTPTENTPPEIMSSNDAFGSFLKDYLARGQDEYAAKIYTQTGGKGSELARQAPKSPYSTVSKAKFATFDAAEEWANTNTFSEFDFKKQRGGTKYYRDTISYKIVPVELGEQTYYELEETSLREPISKTEYTQATAPAPATQPEFVLPAALEGLPELFATTPFDLYGTGVTPPPPTPLSEQELADLGITEDTVFSFDLGNLGSFSLF